MKLPIIETKNGVKSHIIASTIFFILLAACVILLEIEPAKRSVKYAWLWRTTYEESVYRVVARTPTDQYIPTKPLPRQERMLKREMSTYMNVPFHKAHSCMYS